MRVVAQPSLALCDPMDCSLPRLLSPWNFLGKSTGVVAIFVRSGQLKQQKNRRVGGSDWLGNSGST